MKKKVLDKLRSRRGDSLAEVLVAMLISAVALVMLASMIASSGRMIRHSRESMENYDAANNVLASMPDTVPAAVKTVTKASGVELNVKNNSDSKTVRLKTASGALVTVYENAGHAGKTGVAYKKGGGQGMKRLLRKLKRKSGFTLVEVLAVVVILLLVSGVVAAGMPAAANAYTRVVDSGNAQVLISTVKTALREELSTATEVETADGSSELEYYRSARYGVLAKLSVENNAATKNNEIILEYLQEDHTSMVPAVSRPLVSTAAATGLSVEYGSITYAGGLFTVNGLVVKKGSKVLAGKTDDVFQIRVLSS